MIDYIRDHNDFRVEYEKLVSDYINHSKRDISLIDEEDLAQIMAMEKNIEGSEEWDSEDTNKDSDDDTTDTTSSDENESNTSANVNESGDE